MLRHRTNSGFILFVFFFSYTFIDPLVAGNNFKSYHSLFGSLEKQNCLLSSAMHLLYFYTNEQQRNKIFMKNKYSVDPLHSCIHFSSIQALQKLQLNTQKSRQEKQYDRALLIAQELLFYILKPALIHLECPMKDQEPAEHYIKEKLLSFNFAANQHLRTYPSDREKLEYIWEQNFEVLDKLLEKTSLSTLSEASH